MTLDAELTKTLAQMPENLKQELLHYAQYLVANYLKTTAEEPHTEPEKKSRGGLGIWKGKVWMADDFDEPLEDMKDYM